MKPPVPTEHVEQRSVIMWWELFARTKRIDPRLLFAIPNGADKSPAQAQKFKLEGLRPGVPDLLLAYPHRGWPGMFIEMKRQGGKVKPDSEQGKYHQLLRSVGYKVVVAAGAEEAAAAIESYVG